MEDVQLPFLLYRAARFHVCGMLLAARTARQTTVRVLLARKWTYRLIMSDNSNTVVIRDV